METIERRALLRGVTIGSLAFTIGGDVIWLTPKQARAQAWNANFDEGLAIAKAAGAKESWSARGNMPDDSSDGRRHHGNGCGKFSHQQLRPDP